MSRKTSPTKQPNPNKDICDTLMKWAIHERDVTGAIYKFHAYRKASLALSTLDTRIKSGSEAKKLPGIGPKIAEKIDEYLQETSDTNAQPDVDQDQQHDQVNDQLSNSSSKTKVSSKSNKELLVDHCERLLLSPMEVVRLKMLHKVNTVGELREKKDIINNTQVSCLENFDDLCKTISREETDKYIKYITREVAKVTEGQLKVIATGAYRRGVTECENISLLVVLTASESTENDVCHLLAECLTSVLELLKKKNIIKEVLNVNELDRRYQQPFTALCLAQLKQSKPVRWLKLQLVAKNHFVCTLFHTTGNSKFRDRVVQHALRNGYVLDPKSLRKIGFTGVPGQPILLKREEDLFEFIQLPYIEPEQRNK